ncbi:unnamed protein product [Gongylonema pulchrum]|uniref:Snurportin1 domain-containing protein n=1 Tax=Gongylonema pulchrum TaxID=637853 RepID=A0A183DHX2_9BILA|nr:unnamed protein product [Gongylonema pulchrum]
MGCARTASLARCINFCQNSSYLLILLEATVVPDAKQATIRTALWHDEMDNENIDDYAFDPFVDQEQQPDWVTSSVRLGSVRRWKSKKSAAIRRIEKEIELEKQRRSEFSGFQEK